MICGAGLPAVWFHVKPVYNVTGAIRVKPDEQDIVTGDNVGEISNYEGFMNTQAEKVTAAVRWCRGWRILLWARICLTSRINRLA